MNYYNGTNIKLSLNSTPTLLPARMQWGSYIRAKLQKTKPAPNQSTIAGNRDYVLAPHGYLPMLNV
jgi:hypothetical protein